jgi:sporulation protein YlmC with PRC-barrel domain
MKRSILLNTCAMAGALMLAAAGPTWSMDNGSSGAPHAAATSAQSGQIEANKLIGQSVKNSAGDTIGDVDSVLLDKNGKAIAAVIGVGGFLGMGEHEVAVAWNDLKIGDNGRDVSVAFSKDQLKAMPEYRFSSPDRKRTAYYDENYRLSSNTDARAGMAAGTGISPATTGAAHDRVAANDRVNWSAMGPAGEIRASKLTGADVINAQGDKIGDIDEVVFGSNGQPRLILSVGGFLGMGEHRVALDWNKVKLARDKDGDLKARLDMTKDRLQALPEYKFDSKTSRK